MGIDIDSAAFSDDQRATFAERLERQLDALAGCMARPGFGAGPSSIGAELELYIVDEQGRALHDNLGLWEAADDPQLTLELNRYNLEYNLSPYVLGDGGLLATEREMREKLARLSALASERGGHVVPIGILPTLEQDDFRDDCITDRQRYHALVAQLQRWRGSDFLIHINGDDPLRLAVSHIALEGANTSFQIHLRVAPEDYAAMFNALQLVTPLVVAISANSPSLFGHSLWEETRIPLFKQSIDTRHVDRYRWHEPARVCFGQGWARQGALELFRQSVRLYPPLLPACADQDSCAGPSPELSELRLHQSTVWQWNRPVYDHADGGHLRIEMRALPAGPTPQDMLAGAALFIGLARAMAERAETWLPALPFYLAEYNFYRGAQHGLDAQLVWPDARQQGPRERPLAEILAELLPGAEQGLAALGSPREERDRYLGIIERRLAAKTNGARWQRACLEGLRGRSGSERAAFAAMLERYREHSCSDRPVAEWPV